MPFTRLPTFVLGCVGAILWHRHGDAFTRYMNSGRAALKAWGTVAVALVVLGLVEWGPHRELAYVPGKWCVHFFWDVGQIGGGGCWQWYC